MFNGLCLLYQAHGMCSCVKNALSEYAMVLAAVFEDSVLEMPV